MLLIEHSGFIKKRSHSGKMCELECGLRGHKDREINTRQKFTLTVTMCRGTTVLPLFSLEPSLNLGGEEGGEKGEGRRACQCSIVLKFC